MPFDVEAKYLYAIVIFAVDGLLSSIELLSLVYVFPARITTPGYVA